MTHTRLALTVWYVWYFFAMLHGAIMRGWLGHQPIHVFTFVLRGFDEFVYFALDLSYVFCLLLSIWLASRVAVVMGVLYETYGLIEHVWSLHNLALWTWGYVHAIANPNWLERLLRHEMPIPRLEYFVITFIIAQHVLPLLCWYAMARQRLPGLATRKTRLKFIG